MSCAPHGAGRLSFFLALLEVPAAPSGSLLSSAPFARGLLFYGPRRLRLCLLPRVSLQRALPATPRALPVARLLAEVDRCAWFLGFRIWLLAQAPADEGVIPDPASSDRGVRSRLLRCVLPLLEHYKRKEEGDQKEKKKRHVATLWKASRDYWREWLDGVMRDDPGLVAAMPEEGEEEEDLALPSEAQRLLSIWARVHGIVDRLPQLTRELSHALQRGLPPEGLDPPLRELISGLRARKSVADDHLERQLRIDIGLEVFRRLREQMAGVSLGEEADQEPAGSPVKEVHVRLGGTI